MEVKDILGLGKVLPLDKLIELISKSVGKISKSYFDRKDIETKAYEIEKIAEARAKEIKIISTAVKENLQAENNIEYREDKITITSSKDISLLNEESNSSELSLENRVKERMTFQEAKKQLNLENITVFAAEELKKEESVTDEPIDEDWATRFFNIAGDISNEEMQAIWGKILAGEIKQPKTYSLRTLELIRNLSKSEADVFMKVANFAIVSGGRNYLFKSNADDFLKKFNVTYYDIALLIEIGLLQPGDFVTHQLLQRTEDNQRVFTSGNTVLIAKIKANTPTISIPVNIFSASGNELLKLVNPTPNLDYLKQFASSIKSDNVSVQYAHILAWHGDYVEHSPLIDF